MQAKTEATQGHDCICLPSLREGHRTFQVFTEGDQLYDAMIGVIDDANSSIVMESYIFAADEVGERFAQALASRAQAGVRVRLHLDAFGSGLSSFRDLRHRLEAAGVEFKWFHPFQWLHPLAYIERNHRKLLVIDAQRAFLGGFNIRRLNSRILSGDGRQRDTHVYVTGRLARGAADLFDRLWHESATSHSDAIPETPQDLEAILVASHSRKCRQRIACLHGSLIERAQRYLFLTTPYFAPGTVIETALWDAADRGVDVRLLVPRYGDPPVVGWATRAAYEPLMAAGVRIYEYQPRKLHAKACVVDDEWSVIGSANLDYLSLFVNYELVLFAHDRALARVLRAHHERDLTDATEVASPVWRRRGRRERALEILGRAAQRLL